MRIAPNARLINKLHSEQDRELSPAICAVATTLTGAAVGELAPLTAFPSTITKTMCTTATTSITTITTSTTIVTKMRGAITVATGYRRSESLAC
jgi:hypothetical protein